MAFFFVNIPWTDLDSLPGSSIFSERSFEGRFLDVGLEHIMAVSSTNVAISVSFAPGISAVKIKYSVELIEVPCGTPERNGLRSEISSCLT